MRFPAIVVLFACSLALAAPTATFQGLGTDGHAFSSALAISADGSTVVGNSFDETGSQAFRWTRTGGIQGLGGINGDLSTRSIAFGVNGDGSIVVGRAEQPDNVQGFRWTQADGMAGVGSHTSELNAITPDGSIAAGRFNSAPAGATEVPLAATWTHSGKSALIHTPDEMIA